MNHESRLRAVLRACIGPCLLAMLGCGTDGAVGAADSSEASTMLATHGLPPGSSSAAEGSSSIGDTQPSTTADGSSGASTSSAGSSSSESGGGSELDENGCPTTAPRSWIACESFDAITDAATQLSQWNVNADGFAVEAGLGVDGGQALRVRLQPGLQFGGWVTLRFGEGPAAPAIDSPTGQWDELWLRYRLRTAASWPGRPIGDVGEMIAMNGANWGIAADLNLHGEGSLRLAARGWTCIFGGALDCNGRNDWAGTLQYLWGAEGSTVVFDAAHADTWQCVEAHMRLNTPGSSDGEAHAWIDGVAQIDRVGIDWRGTWTDYGINAVRFTNYADPVDAPLEFAIDDVVVGTARIGCD